MPTRKPAAADLEIFDPLPALPPDTLGWRCDPASLAFDSTRDIEPIIDVIGQESAVEALRFGLETDAPGQNIFVRGLSGTGRMTLVQRLLDELRLTCPLVHDRCYVLNFNQPDHPRLATLPRGQASVFRRQIDRLVNFIRDDLAGALSSESMQSRRSRLDQRANNELERLMKPFNDALKEAGLALVSMQAGPLHQTAIFPVVDGKPVPPEEFVERHQRGEVPEDHYKAVLAAQEKFEGDLGEITRQVNAIQSRHEQAVGDLLERSARAILGAMVADIATELPDGAVRKYVDDILNDVIDNHLETLEKDTEFAELYRVNVVLEHGPDDECPVVVENTPTMSKLSGTVDYDFLPSGRPSATHLDIRAGSLLRADGGFLIMEARDLLSEPGAWKVLVRTLRTGSLEIVPHEMGFPMWGPTLKPEPIALNVKVVLLGDTDVYYLLDQYDPDFSLLFKVLADFDTTIPRNDDGVRQYAGVLARIVKEEHLAHFERGAVAALAEHGARIAARRGKLTARFGRLADIARESSFIARKQNREFVTADDVHEATRRTKRRADLPARRFREYVADGTIRIQTQGTVVGQVNGLAVLQAGPLIYGFPARITATIGPGTAGVINIEREAALSGAIHTKGFYILGGLLRHLLRTDHPLAFNASVALEQSYGGIDGDSASAAEMCCLLSALTGVPLRQDLAMTGAIDQMGNILPIGGVNEKIEGFYDACADIGLTGSQGVVIPQANTGDLALRQDIIDACQAGRFHIFAMQSIHDGLELLTGKRAGKMNADGRYPPHTLLALAVQQAHEYWLKASPPIGKRDQEPSVEEPKKKPRLTKKK